jgi:hypothetical protein
MDVTKNRNSISYCFQREREREREIMMKRTGKVRDRKGGVVGTEKEVREVIKELFLGFCFCSWRVFYALFFQICFNRSEV